MIKEEFYFYSSDKKSNVHCISWECDEMPRAIIQIVHGMSEHIERYDDFAKYLSNNGYKVVGNDHLGHGKTSYNKEVHGYFEKNDGLGCLLKDIRTLYKKTKNENPDVPYIIFGHSMGSFITRKYIIDNPDDMDGAIIMGSSNLPGILTSFGMFFCKIIALFKGWKYRSNFVNNLAIGAYNKKFGKKNGFNWLSVDEENVKKYEEDEFCGEMFTLNGFYNLFKCINFIGKNKNINKMNNNKPIFLVSGSNDPVGNYGKDIPALYNRFKKSGIKNIEYKLYNGLRHEILNEREKEEVYNDIKNWIENKF